MSSIERNRPLELSGAEVRDLVECALEQIVQFIDAIPSIRCSQPEKLACGEASGFEELPEKGTDFGGILHHLFGEGSRGGLIHNALNTTGPGYMAYVPGGGIFHSVLADLIAGCVNRYVTLWAAAPDLAQLETNAVRWLCEIVGYSSQSLGFLTSGGSQANLSAVVVARSELLNEHFSRGTVYLSDQAHHSIIKAVAVAGVPTRNIRIIRTDERFRIVIADLKQRIKADRSQGFEPFLLVGNGGTTNTGAVDNLRELRRIAQQESLWFHVDAAYGGFFMLTDRGRVALQGITEADSVTLDPHKGLFLPYGTGSLLVRDGEALKRTFSSHADYLPQLQDQREKVDFCEISPELTRNFRGLRIWLPLKLNGVGVFRDYLDEKLDLARWTYDQLQQIEMIETFGEPELSALAFRVRPPHAGRTELNALNRELLQRINSHGDIFLSGTTLGEDFVIRVCVLSFRTHKQHVEALIHHVAADSHELAHGLV